MKRNITWFQVKLAFLICVFGSGSWVAVNGLFVELPILVSHSPEKWTLPSYLTVVVQIANIGPLAYLLSHKYVSYKSKKVVTETPIIYLIFVVGVSASFLLAFTWKETTAINAKHYSTALLTLSFFLATVDCTSSVTFLPFMAHFPKDFMTVYYIGEGMSGFLPSIAALIQGVGEQPYTCEQRTITKNITIGYRNVKRNGIVTTTAASTAFHVDSREINVTEIVPTYFQTEPRFSAQAFFLIICSMMSCSLIAFVLLTRIKNGHFKNEPGEGEQNGHEMNSSAVTKRMDFKILSENQHELESEEINTSSGFTYGIEQTSKRTFCFLLILNALINGISNGILPALQSYACLPYGNRIYHLTLTLSAVANPVCCFLHFFVKVQSSAVIFCGVCVYLVSAGYTIGIAATSPCPLWNDSDAGGIVVLLVTVFGVGLVSYLKTAISTITRSHGHRGLLFCGISVQVGSLVGALFIFPFINVHGYFKQAQACQIC